jgi:opacity protein-like surface antigen
MKQFIILLCLIFLTGEASKGQDSNAFFFDEFSVSVNRTNLQNDNTEDRYGFGLGAYHSFRSDKKLNIVFGVEYNRTGQFKKSMYEGHFAHTTDLTYTIHCISIPVGIRLNMGSKTKVFIETGGFTDLIIRANRKGKMHTYLPDEYNQIHNTVTDFDEKVKLSNSIGLYFGVGIRIPVSTYELVAKPEYKFGINKLYSYQDDIFNRYFRLNVGLKIK